MKTLKAKNKGFTLIELLVVISIIGMLSSVVLGSLSSARQKAKNSFVSSSMLSYVKALKAYYADKGYYPYDVSYAADDQAFCLGGGGCMCGSYESAFFKGQISEYIKSWDNPSPYNVANDWGCGNSANGALFYCTNYSGNKCFGANIYWFKDASAKCDLSGATEGNYSYCYLAI